MPSTGKTRAQECFELPSNRRPRVLILGDPEKAGAEALGARLRTVLEPHADVLAVALERSYEPLEGKPDLLVVLGGDGGILAASHRLGRRRVPVMGINLGRVGFLSAVKPDRAEAVLRQVFAGEAVCEHRAMVAFEVRRDGASVLDSHVLNEIVIGRAEGETMVTVDLIDDRRPVCTYHGDGVIVSTATGSTAYNLAAGGPILSPRLEALVISPLAPHMLGVRPLVLPADRTFTLRVQGEGTLTSDGHLEGRLRADDRVRVRPSKRKLTLIVDPQERFYKRLRSKLRWGESPGPG